MSARKPIDQISGKEALAGLFSVMMGVADFVEGLERGEDLGVAAKKAVTKTKRRRAALRRAELEVVHEEAAPADAAQKKKEA